MPHLIIDVGKATDLVVACFQDPLLPVGDGVAPENGGWSAGQPNAPASVFVPYVVVGLGGGMAGASTLGCNEKDWNLNFYFRYYGGSRRQADWAATTGRREMHELLHESFNDDFDSRKWMISNVTWNSIGASTRIDTVDPPYWSVTDSITFLFST